MKRRDFFYSTSLAGAATAFTAMKSGSGDCQSADKNKQGAKRILTLKADYYRHYPVDFSKGKDGALGFKSWADPLEIQVPAEETAIIPMHIWNIGISPELPFQSEGQAGGVMDMLEWASRSAPIIKTEIPPILEAARNAGINVVHVASGEGYETKYPGYKKALDIAGKEPESPPRAFRAGEIKPPDDRKSALIFGERLKQSSEYYSKRVDFPPQAKPLDNEYVVSTTHQLNSVLRELKVWNLIYIGFALNWCLWFSPGGMTDMSRLGYRCSCIKEATTAVENKESVVGEQHKQEALWRVSLMFGYVHGADDFIKACSKLKKV